ncbi:hypothetical protein MNBD_ALPHA11-2350 [hydrothermal vent metagenome]|uniref:Uncharacterized protein n=1 Tax=hydrothermal vent metagenome TaxID=652676 RepID=A0A3B0TTK4_9ZZZZ
MNARNRNSKMILIIIFILALVYFTQNESLVAFLNSDLS